jgi:ribosomal protein L3 glutamine methyltransferase
LLTASFGVAGGEPAISVSGVGNKGVSAAPQEDAADERLELFTTPRDWFRHAVSRFNAAGLAYGHGTTNAVDEAAFMVLEGLRLPIDSLEPFLDAKLLAEERRRLAELIDARVATRKPAAYLLGRAYIQGVPFYVDERVIVPRSFIGELLFTGLVGEGGLIESPEAVGAVLELCTGGGSLAILAARLFPNARIDAVDLSTDALEVARRNISDHGLADRITLREGDLYQPLGERRYDLILANPPYVAAESLAAFPPEFAAEPRLAHAGGSDGLDVVRRILARARAYLEPDGALVVEIGQGRARLDAEFPDLPLIWLDTQESEGEVFYIRASEWPAASRKGKRRS